ncbi:MAG: winged helix-turn-helix transcriptional regulator [Minicystis sp.]
MAVGETTVARDFFAGQYAKVAAETFDDPSAALADEDVAFAVGALTFLGRVADAETCFDGWRLRAGARDARTVAASRFFLGVARARAGDFQRAHELLVLGARARVREKDQWAAAFAFQGLACHRYFTGKYRAAARHALRALRAAHVARFAYAQMLSTDLRGHALVQIGQFQAGIALLEQAKSHAERLGFGMNAYAIECSMVVYKAKFKVGPDVIQDLEALLARRSHDSYSRRTVLTQAAVQYALRGRGREAMAALAEVDREALRMDARRAKVTSLIARLYVTRWSRGAEACAELLDDAAAIVDESDVAFRAELLAFEAYVGRALGDAARRARAIAGLRRLSRRAEHHVAKAALEQFEGERARAFAEDEMSPLLRAADRHDEQVLPRLLALGLYGLVPEILGLGPGRRVLLLSTENAVLVQDQGDLWLRPSPPRWAPPLLRILAGGGAAKEAIVAGLWGLKRYWPERHDPLVRTTIHRLRAFLEPRGEWVTVSVNGYGLAVPIHASGAADAGEPLEAPLLDEPLEEAPALPGPATAARDTALVDGRVHERLLRMGEASAPEIAKALGLSESTVLRAVRRLLRAKKITRSGAARATRYSGCAG